MRVSKPGDRMVLPDITEGIGGIGIDSTQAAPTQLDDDELEGGLC